MSLAKKVLAVNNDLPIRTHKPLHGGKVRSVYWLTDADSERLIRENGYAVPPNSPLAVMVISDRISAFDCIWHGEGGMRGVPGKGAALNAISNHWFKLFKEHGLADSHILDVPHPLVWIVQKAKPIKIEAICRQYITGSMWRAYEKGERIFCGITLPEDLNKDQKLEELLITPSTKGVIEGIAEIPAQDDVNITRKNIEDHYLAFNFASIKDIDVYENLLRDGFNLISKALSKLDQIFVDTKFEFGYANDLEGNPRLIYMDEVGTPDSSRIWDGETYRNGKVVEKSKEAFRQLLLRHFPDSEVLLDKNRMDERLALAKHHALPESVMMEVSKTYCDLAEKITGRAMNLSDNPKDEIIEVLSSKFELIV